MKKLLVAVLVMTSFSAVAVEDKEIATCAADNNAVTRLSCFDDLATRHSLAPKTEETSGADISGDWRTFTDTDPLTDRSVHTALLDARTGKGKYGKDITLVVRCKNNKTEMYVIWNSFLGMDHIRTTFRVDKNKAATSNWGVSTDKQAAFFPTSPISLLKTIVDSTSFVASVTPYSESPVTAVFDTTGAKSALANIRKGCNW